MQRQRSVAIASPSGHVEQAAEHRFIDRHHHGTSAGTHRHAALQAGSCLESDAADRMLIEMGLNFEDERFRRIPFNDESFVEPRQSSRRERHVDHGVAHGDYLAKQLLAFRHRTPCHPRGTLMAPSSKISLCAQQH